MQEYETIRRTGAGARTAAIDEGLRAYMNRVYGLMGVAMLITGLVAYVVGTDYSAAVHGEPTTFLPVALLQTLFTSPVVYLIIFAPLLVVFGFSAAIHRMSTGTAQTVFWVFAGLIGLSISSIFAVYTGMSIARVFFITAIAFGALSLYGYTTKKDLSGWGSFLIMGLVGIIIASIVNLFIASSALQFAVSVIGVLIFAGLTAYDTQQIKNEYLQASNMGPQGAAYLEKGAILGALRLYLDFINMFMFLLQLFGNRQ